MSFPNSLSNNENNGVKGEKKHKVERYTLTLFHGTGTWETRRLQTDMATQHKLGSPVASVGLGNNISSTEANCWEREHFQREIRSNFRQRNLEG